MKSGDILDLLRPRIVVGAKPKAADAPTCPKCLWTGQGEEGWRSYLWFSSEEAAVSNLKDRSGKALGECLLVFCSRCKFKWHEPVANPEASEEPS